MQDIFVHIILWSYLGLMLILGVFGAHGFVMIWMVRRLPQRTAEAVEPPKELPAVLIQLPVFNEAAVVERVIDSAARVDYPKDLLTIQVLDDSTDDLAVALAAARCAHWLERGVKIDHVRRADRQGYKAGALQHGLELDHAPFVAVFDADFLVPADFLYKSLGHFEGQVSGKNQDNKVGLVQWRWDHLNRDASWLTRAQAALLDGHFYIEEVARSRAGWWCAFHGTAGIWRRECILDSGGWSSDTLAEDMDLSLRAQIKGWGTKFLEGLGCPAELPPTPVSFFGQQHRWTKGNMEVACKLGPELRSMREPLGLVMEIAWRLYAPLAYLTVGPLLILATILVLLVHAGVDFPLWWSVAAAVLWLGSLGFVAIAIAGSRARGRSWYESLRVVPSLLLLGPAVVINNSAAVIQALLGKRSPFVRTRKFGEAASSASTKQKARLSLPDAALAIWLLAGTGLAVLKTASMIFSPLLAVAGLGCLWAARGRHVARS